MMAALATSRSGSMASVLGRAPIFASAVSKHLDAAAAQGMDIERVSMEAEKDFRWSLNEDAMATEKLAEGIRGFTADAIKLDAMLTAKFNA